MRIRTEDGVTELKSDFHPPPKSLRLADLEKHGSLHFRI